MAQQAFAAGAYAVIGYNLLGMAYSIGRMVVVVGADRLGLLPD